MKGRAGAWRGGVGGEKRALQSPNNILPLFYNFIIIIIIIIIFLLLLLLLLISVIEGHNAGVKKQFNHFIFLENNYRRLNYL